MILEKPKILFVHIPRTGGSSIEKFFDFTPKLDHYKKQTQHSTLQEYSEHCDVKKYFKFTVVRNPWDRLLSWYLWSFAEVIYFQYLSENGQFIGSGAIARQRAWKNGRSLLSNNKNGFVDQKFFLKFKTAFSAFVERLEDSGDLTIDKRYDNLTDINNRLRARWIMPQLRWLELSGKISMDYVCKFEKLTPNFKTFLRKNKLPIGELEKVGKIYNKPAYRKFYNKKNQQIISQVYKEDIKRFKYEF